MFRKKDKENEFNIYIRVLYKSLKKEIISPFIDQKLYRGAKIKKDELEYINNSLKNKKDDLPGCLCYNKSFLSSSLDENIAFGFMARKSKYLKENEELALFIIDKGKKRDGREINFNDSDFASNVDVQEFSFLKEKEILFFPFSSFEIIKIKKKKRIIWNIIK